MKENVTNAMRLLRQAGVDFDTSEYAVDEEDLSGVHAAALLGVEPERVFKTLVARGTKGGIYVFVIPSPDELDPRKAATACGEKKIELVHVKELLGLTGYIRGGCSPVGMKKKHPTFIDETAQLFESIYVSAGVRGRQIIISPEILAEFVSAGFFDLTRS